MMASQVRNVLCILFGVTRLAVGFNFSNLITFGEDLVDAIPEATLPADVADGAGVTTLLEAGQELIGTSVGSNLTTVVDSVAGATNLDAAVLDGVKELTNLISPEVTNGGAVASNLTSFFTSAGELTGVMNDVAEMDGALAPVLENLQDLSSVPAELMDAVECIQEEASKVVPLVSSLAALPVPELTSSMDGLSSKLKGLLNVIPSLMAGIEGPMASFGKTVNITRNERVMSSALSGDLSTRLPDMTAALDQVRDQSASILRSGNMDAMTNMMLSMGGASGGLGVMNSEWGSYAKDLRSLLTNANSALETGAAMMNPMEGLLENASKICSQVKSLTPALSSLLAEVSRPRCFGQNGECPDSLCGTIESAFGRTGLGDNEQLQTLFEPIIGDRLGALNISNLLDDVVLTEVQSVDESIFSQIEAIAVPELPVFEIAESTASVDQFASGEASLMSLLGTSGALPSLPCVENDCGVPIKVSTTTTTTIDAHELPSAECEYKTSELSRACSRCRWAPFGLLLFLLSVA